MKYSGCLYDAKLHKVEVELFNLSRPELLSELSYYHQEFPTTHFYVNYSILYSLLNRLGLLKFLLKKWFND